MPAGSVQSFVFSFVQSLPATTAPWPITGATWEYCVRASPTATGSPLVEITTAASGAGLITITSSATVSQALLQIYPAATAALAPGTYFHALWMNPATSGAYAWFTGQLLIAGSPQP